MILVIDNYDSFTYNLVQYLGELAAELPIAKEILVRRNDQISLEEIRQLQPDAAVISPGPGRPEDAGISQSLIQTLGSQLPILGVCLGHQGIGQVFGGKIVRAPELMHGKTSPILHKGEGLFEGLPSPFDATRYHSLIVKRETFPSDLVITAETAEQEIMGLQHKVFPIYGVQFHPESILTQQGKKILANFLKCSV